MKYPEKQKLLAIFLSALVFLAACKKDSGPTYEPPVTEPLTTAAVKTGDTLVIKGQNFSTTLTDNIVSFNGVVATVISATATELVVVVPANATSGSVTVTVHGNTTMVGALMISPLTLYCMKNNFNQTPTVRHLMALDPATGSQSAVVTLSDYTNAAIADIEYLAATNEIMCLSDPSGLLIKVNLTTKEMSTVMLTATPTTAIIELVVDNSGNLYGVKLDWADQNHVLQSLVKIDHKKGGSTVIKTFEYNNYWESLVYLPTTNQVVGLADDGTRLLKVNLTSKDTSSVRLPGSSVADYRELVVVGSDLYGYKGNYSDPSNAIADLTKINTTTGQETLVAHLSTNGKIHDHLVYLPQRKEIATIWEQTGLFRINVTNLTNSTIPLTTAGITYGPITSN